MFCIFSHVAGKDARLYVFRLRALKKGLDERQLVRGKCDSRENKLEKTKGIKVYSVVFLSIKRDT